MKIKKFDELNEEFDLPKGMWDEDNKKAVKSYRKKSADVEYHITTSSPISVKTTDEEDMEKFKYIFNRCDVKYKVEKKELK